MDIIKFEWSTKPTKLERGSIVNGIKSKTWIERYRDPGEFRFVAKVSSGLREALPLDSLISHTNTSEVMMVENHEIVELRGQEPEIVVSGRSFDAFLEYRIVTNEFVFPNSGAVFDTQIVDANPLSLQIRDIIKRHTIYDPVPFAVSVLHEANGIEFLSVDADVDDEDPPYDFRYFKRGKLHQRVIEHLALRDLGIRVYRPGPNSPLGASDPNILLRIHDGTDKTAEVVLAYDTGELDRAEYLWSNKPKVTAVMASGKTEQVFEFDFIISGDPDQLEHYNRRVIHVDADFIDGHLPDVPDPGDVIAAREAMALYAFSYVLQGGRNLEIVRAEVSKRAVLPKYRVAYDIGDLVTVSGNYGVSTVMRVTEHVEIEDANGSLAYPTISSIA